MIVPVWCLECVGYVQRTFGVVEDSVATYATRGGPHVPDEVLLTLHDCKLHEGRSIFTPAEFEEHRQLVECHNRLRMSAVI